eukprot:7497464-Prorocentrum_lima.AAC.1
MQFPGGFLPRFCRSPCAVMQRSDKESCVCCGPGAAWCSTDAVDWAIGTGYPPWAPASGLERGAHDVLEKPLHWPRDGVNLC